METFGNVELAEAMKKKFGSVAMKKKFGFGKTVKVRLKNLYKVAKFCLEIEEAYERTKNSKLNFR